MKAELMRYRNDKLSFFLVIAGLACDAAYLMMLYSTGGVKLNDKFGFIIGIDIIFNIVYLLISFYTAEKVKTYSMNWCWVSLALGIVQCPRFFLPISLFDEGQIGQNGLVWMSIMLAVSLVTMIAACYTSLVKSKKLSDHLKNMNEKVA